MTFFEDTLINYKKMSFTEFFVIRDNTQIF